MIIGISGYAGSGKDEVCSKIQQLDVSSDWQRKKWSGKLKTIASLLNGIPQENFEDQEFKKTYLPEQWNYYTISLIDNGKLLVQKGRYTTKEEAEAYIPMLKEIYGEFRMEYVVGMQRMTVRQFLQELGTDACRKELHPNTWVNALMADYKSVWNDPNPIPDNDYTITYRENYGDTSLIHYGEGSEAEVFNHEIVEPNWIITDTRFPNEAQAIKDAGGIVIRVDRMHITPINEHYSESALDGWDFDYYIENSGTHQDLFDRVEEFLATIIK